MRQQVNLYQPIFRKQEKVLSANTLAQGLALVAVGLALFYAYAWWQSQALYQQLGQFEQQRTAAVEWVEKLGRAYPEAVKSQRLEQEIERLRSELQLKQRIADRLVDRSMGNLQGFAGHMEALARQKMPQLWLTRIEIRQGGRVLELAGSTYQPEQVPQYLQRLSAESSFAGIEFEHFELMRAEGAPQRVDFYLSTMAGAVAEK